MPEYPLVLHELIWKAPKGSYVLGPLTARVERGVFLALVGPNGSGKTSLLNLLSGLVKPQSGKVQFFGSSFSAFSSRQRGRKMAFLSQDFERPFGFLLSEYVALGRFPHRGSLQRLRAEDQEIIRKEIHFWGLEKFQNRPLNSLSGGEFQRATLARSLVQNPPLLLLDEPVNHLDLASRRQILLRLQAEARAGRNIVAVLHDINDALFYADEVWILKEGRFLSQGLPQEVLRSKLLSDLYGVELSYFTDEKGRKMLGLSDKESGIL